MAQLIVSCNHGKEDPERAILPFVVGNVAASADQQTAILLTVEGVWIATKSYADDVNKEGFPALKEVLQSFIDNGGEIWACGTCTKPRGITDADLIEGARIVTAAYFVEQIASGASNIAF